MKPPTEEKKSRVWEIDLYPDCERHVEILAQLANDVRAVGILHDRDINDEGNPKKPHYHWLYTFDNPRGQGSVEKMYPDLESNLIQYVKSTKSAYRYLLHLDHPEKAQYNKTELLGNASLADRYIRSENDEATEALLLLEWIEHNPDKGIADLMRYAAENNCYATFRRNTYAYIHIIKEAKCDVL